MGFSKENIIKNIKLIRPFRNSDKRDVENFRYIDKETSRKFQIKKEDKIDADSNIYSEFTITEIALSDQIRNDARKPFQKIARAFTDLRIERAAQKYGVNKQVSVLRDIGIDVSLICEKGLYDGIPIVYRSMEDVADAIADVLNNNIYYVHPPYQKPPVVELKTNNTAYLFSYWSNQKKFIVNSIEQEPDELFKGCFKKDGTLISDEVKLIIKNYLKQPSRKKWFVLRDIKLIPQMSFYEQWVKICPQNEVKRKYGWKDVREIPQSSVLRKMIRNAVEGYYSLAEQKMKEFDSESKTQTVERMV